MKIFLTGANGYIGGAAATSLIAAGHKVRGLVRDEEKAGAVAAHGVCLLYTSPSPRDTR